MNEGFQVFEILIWAGLAAFIGLRLRSVLGRRTGQERKPPRADNLHPYRPDSDDDKVVSISDRGKGPVTDDSPLGAETAETAESGPGSEIEAALTRIMDADRSFEPDGFLSGARNAYELIVTAFAMGDRDALKPLLDDQVYRDFSAAIEAREEAGETAEVNIVGNIDADFVGASFHSRMAKVTVRFVSDLIRATRDAQDRIIEGNASVPREVVDIWTFARDIGSRDPNWVLVATSGAD